MREYVDKWIEFGLYQSVGTGGVIGVCLCLSCGRCGWCRCRMGKGLDQGLERWGSVISG